MEATIEELTAELDAQRVLLRNITDAQYKLLNETILAIFQTTDPRKLEYLRAAVRNELAMTNLVPQEATFLSRIIRDISADEAAFVVENFSHREIQIADIDLSDQPSRLVISPASKEGLIASGLVALGLLVSEAITWNGSNILRFSDIVAKLIVLLRK
ncbi:MAG TPA: hypothetical protein PLS93_09105 [Accumulibacter sp.]|nr:hypothetical protein [Accumulibacter sp.]